MISGELRLMAPAHRLGLPQCQYVTLPHSEVCMHMKVAGQRRPVVELDGNMVQILNGDGTPFSMPVTRGEAGLPYQDWTEST